MTTTNASARYSGDAAPTVILTTSSVAVAPPNTTAVSWLPFYHDMGLMLGVCAPILGGWHSVFTTPASFLARPARWMQLLARCPHALSAAPNFAFELAAGRTSDDDMAGLDLGHVLRVLSGSERVHVATLTRFFQRFARFNLHQEALRPSYGLAEATLYVATRPVNQPPNVAYFEPEKLSAGHAKRCGAETGTALVSYGNPESPLVRIVDPETGSECSAGMVGEIWVHGDNVCLGYWEKPEQTEKTFGGKIVAPSPGTPEQAWLRTGDLGFVSEDELFIVGRFKDLLIVRGLNHYPDDIEATIQKISGGRVAAISVEDDHGEQLVVIVEAKKRGDSEEEAMNALLNIKREVTSAISNSHGRASRTSFWRRAARFRSPRVARSGGQAVSSCTATISSCDWTVNHQRASARPLRTAFSSKSAALATLAAGLVIAAATSRARAAYCGVSTDRSAACSESRVVREKRRDVPTLSRLI